MKVYKFGGASVKDAEGIRNVLRIVSREKGDLIIVVSAMGKTTNALERVVNARWENCEDIALSEYTAIRNQHQTIAKELELSQTVQQALFATNLVSDIPLVDNYDLFYDQIVCTGELNSSRLLSAYLNANGVENELLMMPQLLITDTTYREAKVNMTVSAENVRQAIGQSKAHVFVTQGFIGGTPDKHFTTLGREGSDYSAALLANFVDAESVTIWKDVPGILNADPRLVENTILIPELSYSEAVELAVTTPNCRYSLGSVLNHVSLHQTVIGLEAEKQMEMARIYLAQEPIAYHYESQRLLLYFGGESERYLRYYQSPSPQSLVNSILCGDDFRVCG